MILFPGEPDASAFAPYGALIERPAMHGDRRIYSDWLAPVDACDLQFHINSVACSDLPLTLDQVECHPHAAQVFVPLNVSRYLVVAMPSGPDGGPDPAAALLMVVPGSMGVIYRAGCWHSGVTVLDHDASFAVLMWRGMANDDVFVPIPALQVQMAATTSRRTQP